MFAFPLLVTFCIRGNIVTIFIPNPWVKFAFSLLICYKIPYICILLKVAFTLAAPYHCTYVRGLAVEIKVSDKAAFLMA